VMANASSSHRVAPRALRWDSNISIWRSPCGALARDQRVNTPP
jgi:hypothetical protein